MKVATWNINGIVKRLPLLLDWLGDAAPNVLCLQELKCTDASFPVKELHRAGYGAVWECEGRWNGVAILARDSEPVPTCRALPGNSEDAQARYIEAAISGIIFASLYVPNGNPQPGSKFDYKLKWMDRLHRHVGDLIAQKVPVILAGDFNVAPTARDIYDETTSYRDSALIHPACRKAFFDILDLGLADTLRTLFPDGEIFTFWDYRRRRWERNAGLRLDHILAEHSTDALLEAGGIDRPMRSRRDASDHVPVWISLPVTKTIS